MDCWDFPKNDFYKKTKIYVFLQNQNYQNFTKKRTICCITMPGHLTCQISGRYISIFGKHVAQKPYPWMMSFFHIAILSISRHRTKIKMTFLEFGDQTGSEINILYSKKIIRKFDLMWPGVDPTLPCRWISSSQIAKWRRFLNFTCESD